jgi:hypothetical protein
MDYGILNPTLVYKAFEIVRPLIEVTMNGGYTHRRDLAVVVTATEVINPREPDMSFENNCYLVSYLGNIEEWEYDYKSIALSKAELSVRTGKGSAELGPQYLLLGDTIYWGSVVLDGIVVACSGVKPYYDEMFSMWIAAAVKALCKERFAEYPKDRSFIL